MNYTQSASSTLQHCKMVKVSKSLSNKIWHSSKNNNRVLDELVPVDGVSRKRLEGIRKSKKSDKEARRILKKLPSALGHARALGFATEPKMIRDIYKWQMKKFKTEDIIKISNFLHENNIDGRHVQESLAETEWPEKDKAKPPFIRLELSKEYPCFVQGLEVINMPMYGRGIITNRAFNVGEIIAVEAPFALAATNINGLTYCLTCAATNCALLPCSYCAHAFFCSRRCQLMNQTHKYECGTTFHTDPELNAERKCIVNMVLTGIATFDGNIRAMREKTMEAIGNQVNREKRIPKIINTAERRYYCMLHLAHSNNRGSINDVGLIYTAMMSYARIRQLFRKRINQIFLQHLIGHCIKVVAANCFDDSNMVLLYGATSFFNHSCAPNVGILPRGTVISMFFACVLYSSSMMRSFALCRIRDCSIYLTSGEAWRPTFHYV